MELTEELDKTLQHYGIKGMRWGVHRRSGSGGGSSEPEDVVIRTTPGKRVQVSGGRNQPASEEAKKAAAYRQKARASSVDSLSNAELKLLVERLNLENNYMKLTAADRAPSKGKAFMQKMLKEEGGALVTGKVGPRTQFVQMIIKAGGGLRHNPQHAGAQYVSRHAVKGRP